MSALRAALVRARRIVVKVGSRALAADPELPARLGAQIAEQSSDRRAFVVVSSGAIALGGARLGYRTRPREMARLQAAAAAGQSVLMRRWEEGLAGHGLTAAQVLLTHADLEERDRVNNARQALAALLEAGAVPIVNENDTVSTEEIAFGDNDQLAAMMVPLVGADLLVLLTDVDGVLDAGGRVIPLLADETVVAEIAASGGRVGSGGIASKLDAAKKATLFGASVVIGPARRADVLRDIVCGESVGTLLAPRQTALKARKHWIAFTLRPKGTVLLDAGAARAIRAGKGSLLPVGVLGVRGQWNAGDPVRLVSPAGEEIGRGLCRLSALDVARVAGLKGEAIIIHRDDLVTTS